MTADRCPGVLRPHQAADGAMVRVRVPGGQTTGPQLAALARLAERHGSGLLQLTSRASLQVRGLPEVPPEAFRRGVVAAGFLPSADHERVRNIVCSPLTGLADGRTDLRGLVGQLDQAIIAEPELTALSGRFLFGLDDGRGDIRGLGPDLAYHATGTADGLLLVGGELARPVPMAGAVSAIVDLARSFVAAAAAWPAVWRVRDLPGWVESLAGLRPVGPANPAASVAERAPTYGVPLGRVGPHASVAVPLGLLTRRQLQVVSEVAGAGPVVLTPWRGLVLPGAGGQLDRLEAAGLVVDAASIWTTVSACVGGPWCGQARIDTQNLIRSVAHRDATWPRTHVSGCERRCGAPAADHLDLVAPSPRELLAAARPTVVARG